MPWTTPRSPFDGVTEMDTRLIGGGAGEWGVRDTLARVRYAVHSVRARFRTQQFSGFYLALGSDRISDVRQNIRESIREGNL